MDRQALKQFFGSSGPAILPVIHVIDSQQTNTNIELALEEGAHGLFLINHDFGIDEFIPIIREARTAFPQTWIALNFLAVTGKRAFPRLAELESEGIGIDGYWGDDARIDEHSDLADQPEAMEINRVRQQVGWDGLYFGGTAFKKQRAVLPADYAVSAHIAAQYMDVVTTSGIATGHEADLNKIEVFRQNIGETALALASGVTPDNAHLYQDNVDAFMVAKGINHTDDFYHIDRQRLRALMQVSQH